VREHSLFSFHLAVGERLYSCSAVVALRRLSMLTRANGEPVPLICT